MPIKGLTDNPRVPRLGKIHLGIKKKSERTGSEYPSATDYFVCPPEVHAKYGEQPKELKIMFPTENPEQWASTYYRAYSNFRGLVCKGDGETANRSVNIKSLLDKDGVLPDLPKTPEHWPIVDREANPEDITRIDIDCWGQECPAYVEKRCRQMMMLQFILPEIPGLGIYQLDTSSFNSIRNVYGAIELIRAMLGRLAMVPLTLKLEEMQVTPNETGTTKGVHVLNIACDFTLEGLAAYQLGQGHTNMEGRELPVPDDEIPDDLVASAVLEQAEGLVGSARETPSGEILGPDEAPDKPEGYKVVLDQAARHGLDLEGFCTKVLAQPSIEMFEKVGGTPTIAEKRFAAWVKKQG